MPALDIFRDNNTSFQSFIAVIFNSFKELWLSLWNFSEHKRSLVPIKMKPI